MITQDQTHVDLESLVQIDSVHTSMHPRNKKKKLSLNINNDDNESHYDDFEEFGQCEVKNRTMLQK